MLLHSEYRERYRRCLEYGCKKSSGFNIGKAEESGKDRGNQLSDVPPVVFSLIVPAEAFTLEIQGEPGTEGGNAYIYAYRF